jgi:hypothetical protein
MQARALAIPPVCNVFARRPRPFAGLVPAAPAGHALIALPPATVTPGHSSTKARVAVSPIIFADLDV